MVSYGDMKEETKHILRKLFQVQPLQPIDPATDRCRFVYALAPHLRFGRVVSDRGNISVPRVTDDNKPVSLVSTFYTAGDERYSGATAAIGEVVLGVNEREERNYYGLTLATVWNGEPVISVDLFLDHF